MSSGKKAQAAVLAGLLACSTAVPALATTDRSASAGAQTGSGVTEVTVISNVGDNELSGPGVTPLDNPAINPDDPTSPGRNIAFTVPSSINFVADAAGNLTGPSADVTYIENESVFAIHATSFDVDAENGWTIIEDGTTAVADNSADFQFGPEGDSLDAHDYLDKTDVAHPEEWNMGPAVAGTAVTDRVQMSSSGQLQRVTKDISETSQIAIIKTYVKAGVGSAAEPTPGP